MNDKITNHVPTTTGKTIDSSQRRGMRDDTYRHSDCLRDTSLLSSAFDRVVAMKVCAKFKAEIHRLGHCRMEVQRIVALS